MKPKHLYGQRFGHLTAIAATNEKRYDSSVWICKCDCGNFVEVPIGYLTSGNKKSCGKCQYNGKDISGQTFGQLTAIAPTGEKIGSSYLWKCRCSCGNEIVVPKILLLNGRKTHCGCLSPEKGQIEQAAPAMEERRDEPATEPKPTAKKSHPKDITGQRFGRLTALYNTGEKTRGVFIWHCVCDCGNEKDVPISLLTSGGTTSCGCAKRGVNTKDIAGQSFNYLTAIEPTGHYDHRHVIWRCRCVCGKEIEAPINRITHGSVKSCGCKAERKGKAPEDLTGKKFGRLTALFPTGERFRSSIVWRCRCDCGNEKDVPAVRLKTGHTQSCGCAVHQRLYAYERKDKQGIKKIDRGT